MLQLNFILQNLVTFFLFISIINNILMLLFIINFYNILFQFILINYNIFHWFFQLFFIELPNLLLHILDHFIFIISYKKKIVLFSKLIKHIINFIFLFYELFILYNNYRIKIEIDIDQFYCQRNFIDFNILNKFY